MDLAGTSCADGTHITPSADPGYAGGAAEGVGDKADRL